MALFVLIAVWAYDSKLFHGNYPVIVLMYLLLSSIVLSVLRVDPSILHQKLAGPRYFFYPFIVQFWILLQIASSRTSYRNLAFLLLGFAVWNALPVWARSHDDLNWKAHVRSSCFFSTYTFPVHFDGQKALAWQMVLSEHQSRPLIERNLFGRLDDAENATYPYTVIAEPVAVLSGIACDDVIVTKPDEFDRSIIAPEGFVVVGAGYRPDATNSEIVLSLRRGDKILYRCGPGGEAGRVLIESTGKRFLQDLPVMAEWTCLDFANRLLPERFQARFYDDRYEGEPSIAIALKNRAELPASGKKR